MTPLPHNPEIEQHVLSVCMKDGGETYRRAVESGVTEACFHDPRHVHMWRAFARMPVPDSSLLALEPADSTGGAPYVFEIDNKAPTTAFAGHVISQLLELSAKRQIIRNAADLIEHARNGTSLEELAHAAKALTPEFAVASDWLARRVKLTAPPSEPSTRLFLAGKPIATPGNLVTVISRAKTGKTTALGGAVAAIIAAHHDRRDLDTLGFTAPHTDEAVVLIDTEQSPFDAWTCHQRTMARAAQPDDPAWLHHYALVGYSHAQLRAALPVILKKARKAHGGIFTLILDGVADFVPSVNDEIACNEFISWLRSLSIEFDCPIVCVIHSNEGVKNGDDGRGWLGKELTRKAESNLLLKKVGSVTTITSEKQRKAPITEADNVAFQWDDAMGRHVSCKAATTESKTGRPTKYQFSDVASVFPKFDQKGMTRNTAFRYASEICPIKETAFREVLIKAVRDGELIADQQSGIFYYRLPLISAP